MLITNQECIQEIKMKITKQRLQQIIQEEVNSHKASQLNESIDVETVDNLEAAIKQAYQEMTTSTDVDQTYADTGEPVSKDPEAMHQKAVEMIMQIVSDVTDPRFQSNRVSEDEDVSEQWQDEEARSGLGEKLKPSDGAGAYVDDFRKSDAPQFKGKGKKKKQQMAIAAYLDDKD